MGHTFKGRDENAFTLSHLLFADDTLVFCKDSEEQLVYLNWILLCFEELSGLEINLNKSMVIPMAEVRGIDQLAVELGCNIGALPSTYLGLPLGARFNSVFV